MAFFGRGSETYNQHTTAYIWEEATSLYTSGGITVDLSKIYSSLNYLYLETLSVQDLPGGYTQVVTLNSPSAGKAKVQLFGKRYDQVTTIGNINSGSQPTGVTIQAASGVASSSESSHTHSIEHNHASFNSNGRTDAGAAVLLDALGPVSFLNHNHALDLPNLTGTSGAGTSHNHTDNTIYQHQHSFSYTSTRFAADELANGVTLRDIWFVVATGVKA